MDNCPYYKTTLLSELFASTAWIEKEASLQEFFTWLEGETGYTDVNLPKFYDYYDPIYVQYVHSLLHLPEVAAEISTIIDIANWSETHKKSVGSRYIGGPLLYAIGSNMNLVVTSDPEAKKLVQYSGHDSTLMSLLSALKLVSSFGRVPAYASAIIFELWEEDDGSFSVTGRFRDGVSEVVTPLDIPTTYTSFQDLVTEMGISDEEWCAKCNATWTASTAPAACLRFTYDSHLVDDDDNDDADDNDDDNQGDMNDDDDNDNEEVYKILSITFIVSFGVLLVLYFVLPWKGRSRYAKATSATTPLTTDY
jgi:hypothetical protein